ncbi:Charged multivesicular body protein 4b [Armadillidium vulgare]|nr:Charged multivesicular body protein 4b [Armadillidium vulgare]
MSLITKLFGGGKGNKAPTAGEAIKRDVDKVHDMMDDIAEQQDVAREISEAISNPVAFGQDVDEDELMAELEELEQEALDEKLLETGEVSADLPEVPTATPAQPARKKKEAEEDPDMAELAAWAL